MRLEGTADTALFLATMDTLGFPHDWPPEFINASIKAFVMDGAADICGAVWYHWGPVPGHVYGHFCLDPRLRITRNIIGDFHKFPELMGGMELRVALEGCTDDIKKMAVIAGWQRDGDYMFEPLNPCRWTKYVFPPDKEVASGIELQPTVFNRRDAA
jgi:hypothetical protein